MADSSTVELTEGLAVGYGKYELQRLIGRGGMGQVWLARHRTLAGEFAIKFLDRNSEDPAAMARFQFEAQIAARIAKRTRHIVTVSDHGEEWGFAYLVMEYVDGETLDSAIVRTNQADLALVSEVVAQVAKGLAGAHSEGVFHRDLKPANVLLSRDEDGKLLAKILDFGIAKTSRSHRLPHRTGLTTDEGVVLGTPSYMSPEQARGLASLDYRCDLWALSTLAYEALTGRLPYDGETTADLMVNICTADYVPVRQYRPDLPASAEAFFAQAFAPRIQDRFQDAGSLAAAFGAITSRPVEALPMPSRPPEPAVEETAPSSEPEIAVANTQSTRPVAPRLVGLVVIGAATFALAVIGFSRLSVRRSEATPDTTPTVVTEPSSVASSTPSSSVTVAQNPPSAPASSPIAIKPKTPPMLPVLKPIAAPSASAPPTPTTPPPAPSPKPIDKGEIL